ncbi:hypothetical protein ACRAWD_09365 [Caulobacter segnis]
MLHRQEFNCWGQLPKVNGPEFSFDYMKESRKFGEAIWQITGNRDVDMVFEHPGEATFPVSVFVVKARRHGRHLRRHLGLQPDHGRPLPVDAPEARAGVALRQPDAGQRRQPAAIKVDRRVDPCLSEVFPWRGHPRRPRERCWPTSTCRGTWRCWCAPNARACGRSKRCRELSGG